MQLLKVLYIPHDDNFFRTGGYDSQWRKTTSSVSIFKVDPSTIEVQVVAGKTTAHFIGMEGVSASNFTLQDLSLQVQLAGATAASSGTAFRGVSIYGIRLESCSLFNVNRLLIQTGLLNSKRINLFQEALLLEQMVQTVLLGHQEQLGLLEESAMLTQLEPVGLATTEEVEELRLLLLLVAFKVGVASLEEVV
jgi:hypothetical protein